MTMLTSQRILIGASGWLHSGWQEQFYPEDLPQDWQLAYYGNEFPVVLIREQAGNANEILDRLGELITLSDDRRARIDKDMRQRSAFVPVTVAEHLTWEEFALVSSNAPALPGILPEVGLTRIYPFENTYCHIVGYVGPVSESDLARMEDPDPLFQIPRYPIGKTGVERNVEETLRGSAGTSRIEVNSVGRVMRELGRDDGNAGKDIQLTLDTHLQEYAMKRILRSTNQVAVVRSCIGLFFMFFILILL